MNGPEKRRILNDQKIRQRSRRLVSDPRGEIPREKRRGYLFSLQDTLDLGGTSPAWITHCGARRRRPDGWKKVISNNNGQGGRGGAIEGKLGGERRLTQTGLERGKRETQR